MIPAVRTEKSQTTGRPNVVRRETRTCLAIPSESILDEIIPMWYNPSCPLLRRNRRGKHIVIEVSELKSVGISCRKICDGPVAKQAETGRALFSGGVVAEGQKPYFCGRGVIFTIEHYVSWTRFSSVVKGSELHQGGNSWKNTFCGSPPKASPKLQ